MNNHQLKIFIGSSSEQKEIAEELKRRLGNEFDVSLWSDFFDLGTGTLENLDSKGREYDFAILILAADDKIFMRGQEKFCVRDNVIFELGLFIGMIGRKNTFALIDEKAKMHIPSDLWGITMATYQTFSEGNVNLDDAYRKVHSSISNQKNTVSLSYDMGKKLAGFDYKEYLHDIKLCREKLRILHTFVSHFNTDNADLIFQSLRDAICSQKNLRIQFLFLNPYSKRMALRIKESSAEWNMRHELIEMYAFFYDLCYNKANKDIMEHVEIKLYDEMPPFGMFQVDNYIYLGSYPKSKPISNSAWFKFPTKTTLGKLIMMKFHEVWGDNKVISIKHVYFINISNRKFHYIKANDNFYIGLTGETKNYEDLLSNSSFKNPTNVKWIGFSINAEIGEYRVVSNEEKSLFEQKYPNEIFIKFYHFKCKRKEFIDSELRFPF